MMMTTMIMMMIMVAVMAANMMMTRMKNAEPDGIYAVIGSAHGTGTNYQLRRAGRRAEPRQRLRIKDSGAQSHWVRRRAFPAHGEER
jgi:membrane protein YqaA with SNARE-associated domain